MSEPVGHRPNCPVRQGAHLAMCICPAVIIDLPATQKIEPLPFSIARVGSTQRQQQDIYMLKNPQHWPHALLAMKRYVRSDPPENDQAPLRVSYDTIAGMEFASWDGKCLRLDTSVCMGIEAKPPSMIVEMTPEQVIAAGWTVD